MLGVLLLTNLLAAHALRFRISWRRSDVPLINAGRIVLALLKRSGIILIHTGLIVLMMSELVTGLFAVEGNMPIATGSSTNFIERNEHMELAVVGLAYKENNKVDKEHEAVTSVPSSILRKGGLIRNEALPFDVQVLGTCPTRRTWSRRPRGRQPGHEGPRTQYVAIEQPEGVGVDSDQKFDAPSAYLELKAKGTGESLGVYLVSAMMRKSQTVPVGDKAYEISLRPHRDYKPYTIYLQDFTHSVYTGTDIPKDFRSRVHITGPGESRDAEIYMNAPLRYQGETFYQAGVLGSDEGTILQVVRNPGAFCRTSPARWSFWD